MYSVGYVTVSKRGDVYHIHKIGGYDMHTSRHASGEFHWKSKKNNFLQKIRKGIPIKDFRGIEFLGTLGFGLDSLPELYSEYKMKKCNGIFTVDMREYKDAAFNMSIAILTEEGLPKLYSMWKESNKKQIYLFMNSTPMVAITVADVRITKK